MFLIKLLSLVSISFIVQLVFAENSWAWGPAIHTVIACKILNEASQLLPLIGGVIRSFPLEYIYGSLVADFFVGKGRKKKDGHSHNWETGFKFLGEAKDEREAAYAYGFFSHLAADITAHNYFIPNLIHQASTWKTMGHIYWEVKADHFVGPVFIKIARDVLTMEELGCDEQLKSAVGRGKNGLKARKRIFTRSVKLSDFLNGSQNTFFASWGPRYEVPNEYLVFMINLSYRLVKDFLTYPESSPCLSYDPIGSRNLELASQNGIITKIFNIPHPNFQFTVDKELLEL